MIKNCIELKSIKYWVFDVDGTMTDGSVYYNEAGNEIKRFNTRDAVGFFAVHACGMKIIVLTGRECKATQYRMNELKVDFLFQNIKNKEKFLKDFMETNQIRKEEVAYIGDDLNDLCAMKLAGFAACPEDACEEIKSISDYVSHQKGGNGVIRDVVSYVVKQRGEWGYAVERICQMYGGRK